MNSDYCGPNFIEGYLQKKKRRSKGGINTSWKYFRFSIIDKERSFIMKNKKEDAKASKVFSAKQLRSFYDYLNKEDNVFDNNLGFRIITTKKNYVIYASSKEEYDQWMRILNYYFNKVDILNPFSREYLDKNKKEIEFDEMNAENHIESSFKPFISINKGNKKKNLNNLDKNDVQELSNMIVDNSQIKINEETNSYNQFRYEEKIQRYDERYNKLSKIPKGKILIDENKNSKNPSAAKDQNFIHKNYYINDQSNMNEMKSNTHEEITVHEKNNRINKIKDDDISKNTCNKKSEIKNNFEYELFSIPQKPISSIKDNKKNYLYSHNEQDKIKSYITPEKLSKENYSNINDFQSLYKDINSIVSMDQASGTINQKHGANNIKMEEISFKENKESAKIFLNKRNDEKVNRKALLSIVNNGKNNVKENKTNPYNDIHSINENYLETRESIKEIFTIDPNVKFSDQEKDYLRSLNEMHRSLNIIKTNHNNNVKIYNNTENIDNLNKFDSRSYAEIDYSKNNKNLNAQLNENLVINNKDKNNDKNVSSKNYIISEDSKINQKVKSSIKERNEKIIENNDFDNSWIINKNQEVFNFLGNNNKNCISLNNINNHEIKNVIPIRTYDLNKDIYDDQTLHIKQGNEKRTKLCVENVKFLNMKENIQTVENNKQENIITEIKNNKKIIDNKNLNSKKDVVTNEENSKNINMISNKSSSSSILMKNLDNLNILDKNNKPASYDQVNNNGKKINSGKTVLEDSEGGWILTMKLPVNQSIREASSNETSKNLKNNNLSNVKSKNTNDNVYDHNKKNIEKKENDAVKKNTNVNSKTPDKIINDFPKGIFNVLKNNDHMNVDNTFKLEVLTVLGDGFHIPMSNVNDLKTLSNNIINNNKPETLSEISLPIKNENDIVKNEPKSQVLVNENNISNNPYFSNDQSQIDIYNNIKINDISAIKIGNFSMLDVDELWD